MEETTAAKPNSKPPPSSSAEMFWPSSGGGVRRLRRLATLFRLLELILFVSLLSWLSLRLPFAVRISAHFLKHVGSVVVSPLFVFALGNAIVITLVAKSGQLTNNSDSDNASHSESVLASLGPNLNREVDSEAEAEAVAAEEVVFEDKEMISREVVAVTDSTPEAVESRLLRTQSENVMVVVKEEKDLEEKRMLRRSETDVSKAAFEEDEMSSEEFRRIIEAFIAKQKRFRREELQAIVVSGQA